MCVCVCVTVGWFVCVLVHVCVTVSVTAYVCVCHCVCVYVCMQLLRMCVHECFSTIGVYMYTCCPLYMDIITLWQTLFLHTHSKADEVIYQLKYSTPNPDYYAYSYADDSSFVASPWNEPIKLRVRCRGKVHKIAVQKVRQPMQASWRKTTSSCFYSGTSLFRTPLGLLQVS